MRGQYEELSCPFCDKGKILIVIFPRTVRFKRGTWGGSKMGKIVTKEQGFIQTKECSICHKSANEIKKELKIKGIIDFT